MSDESNPLIPAGYDVAWSVIAILVIAITVAALVTLARSARRLTVAQTLLWTLVILFVPFVGAISWLAIGHQTGAVERTPVS